MVFTSPAINIFVVTKSPWFMFEHECSTCKDKLIDSQQVIPRAVEIFYITISKTTLGRLKKLFPLFVSPLEGSSYISSFESLDVNWLFSVAEITKRKIYRSFQWSQLWAIPTCAVSSSPRIPTYLLDSVKLLSVNVSKISAHD